VVVAGYLLGGGGLTLYLQIIQGAKMFLSSYSLSCLCMERLQFGGGGAIGANFCVCGLLNP